ncbi:MAG TPA: DUF1573 domain-containing protein [Chthoniobacteraceae bacterium]|nr:DUF1573 domain-containing protein [Chthoniobacteraceae bacterium]
MLHRALFVLLLLGLSASAELRWEKPWQQFQRAPEDGRIETAFAFENKGATPVTIKSVRSSCGCTTARLEKKVIGPGERGEVKARFMFGDRKGPQRKVLTVATDDGHKQELNLVVVIQQALSISPALALWRVGQPADAKVVRLQATPGTPVRVQRVQSSNREIAARLVTVKAGEQYDLILEPTGTGQKQAAEVTVQTDFPPDAPRAYTVHARIK